MRDFAKIYSTILDSSVWGESKDVKILWVTLLAMGANTGGLVEASVGGLARRAGLTREECEVALEVLLAPDPDDKSGVDEGRRIQKTERGWSITNHKYYRDFRTDAQVQNAERQQRFRDNHPKPKKSKPASSLPTVTPVTSNGVTPHNAEQRTDSDRERDLDQKTPPPKDLKGSAPEAPSVVVGEGSKAPEQPEWQERPNATPCPTDLPEKLIAKGVHLELAQHLKVDVESVVHELRKFRDFWVVGKNAGQSRSFWAGKARQWVIDTAAQNKLTPTGALAHAERPLTEAQRDRVKRAIEGGAPRRTSASGPSLVATVLPIPTAAGGSS